MFFDACRCVTTDEKRSSRDKPEVMSFLTDNFLCFFNSRIITPIHSVVAPVTALGTGDLTHTCAVMSNDETSGRVSGIKENTVLLQQITSDLNTTVEHFKLP